MQILNNAKTFLFNIERVLKKSKRQSTFLILDKMTSQPSSTFSKFIEAKTVFLKSAREAKATDGIIDNGQEMEDQLVSRLGEHFLIR